MTLLQYNFATDLNPSSVASGVSGSIISNGSLFTLARDFNGYATDPILHTNPPNSAASASAAVSANSYFAFTVTPDAGKKITITSVTWNGARGGASTPRGWAIRSSKDGYASNLASADYATQRTTFAGITVDLSADSNFQNQTGPITFRIYIYAPNNGTSTEQDDLTVNGDITTIANNFLAVL